MRWSDENSGLVGVNQADERPKMTASELSSGVEIVLQAYRHSVEWALSLAEGEASGHVGGLNNPQERERALGCLQSTEPGRAGDKAPQSIGRDACPALLCLQNGESLFGVGRSTDSVSQNSLGAGGSLRGVPA